MTLIMRWSTTALFILCIACLTILSSASILILLSQTEVIAFTGGGWWVNAYHGLVGYLGSSIIFFITTLVAYTAFFWLTRRCLSLSDEERDRDIDLRFYNGGMDNSMSLFVGIGVIYTSYGISMALVAAIANLSQEEAGRLGAWGILKRLVDNGILIALWTTIVGGTGAYIMRFFRYVFLGRALIRIGLEAQQREKAVFFSALDSIRMRVESIDEKLRNSQ